MNSLKLVLMLLVIAPLSLLAQNDTSKNGRALFNDKCFACHRFEESVIGPPLGGISQKHDTAWLRAWLKDSDKLTCVTNLDEKQIDNIIVFIDGFPIKKDDILKVKGKKIFNANCAACHKLDKRLIGPALKGISDRREREWLHAFIKDSPKLIASGDSLAVQVYEKYNKIPMVRYPHLSEEDIDALLTYFKEEDME